MEIFKTSLLYYRRLYMKKCGQLFDEKAGSEEARRDTVRTTKQAMRVGANNKKNKILNTWHKGRNTLHT